MVKLVLNVWENYISTERLAELLESFGVTCDRKKNGNIWVRQSSKANDDFSKLQDAVYDIFRNHGGKPRFLEINNWFFDHAGCYTADDKTTICVFSPYSGEFHWPALIQPLWEQGYYVEIRDRNDCCSRNCVIFVRERKENDKIFRVKDTENTFYTYDLDYSRYILKNR